MLGGMTTSMAPMEVRRPAEKRAGYPALLRAGSMARPMVATDAALSPDMAPKRAEEQTVVTPSPPGTRPTPALTKSTRRRATEPRPMSSPVKMKKGMARRV